MTETSATVETVAFTTDVAERFSRRVVAGVLSNIESDMSESGEFVLASLATTYKGVETVRNLIVSGDALTAVRDMLVEGAEVRFYGEMRDGYVAVIGPDLTKRNLARAEKAAAPVATAPKAEKAKRPMTEKQAAAWNTIVLPRLLAGRAKAAAARAVAA